MNLYYRIRSNTKFHCCIEQKEMFGHVSFFLNFVTCYVPRVCLKVVLEKSVKSKLVEPRTQLDMRHALDRIADGKSKKKNMAREKGKKFKRVKDHGYAYLIHGISYVRAVTAPRGKFRDL